MDHCPRCGYRPVKGNGKAKARPVPKGRCKRAGCKGRLPKRPKGKKYLRKGSEFCAAHTREWQAKRNAENQKRWRKRAKVRVVKKPGGIAVVRVTVAE